MICVYERTRGAASNWDTTWWRNTARWAGRDLSKSILWKQLHSPLIWALTEICSSDKHRVVNFSVKSKNRLLKLYLFLLIVKVVVLRSDYLGVYGVWRACHRRMRTGVLIDTFKKKCWVEDCKHTQKTQVIQKQWAQEGCIIPQLKGFSVEFVGYSPQLFSEYCRSLTFWNTVVTFQQFHGIWKFIHWSYRLLSSNFQRTSSFWSWTQF